MPKSIPREKAGEHISARRHKFKNGKCLHCGIRRAMVNFKSYRRPYRGKTSLYWSHRYVHSFDNFETIIPLTSFCFSRQYKINFI